MLSKKTLYTEETQPESFISDSSVVSVAEEDPPVCDDNGILVFTDDELTAMRLVQTRLREHHGILDIESRLNSSFLAVPNGNFYAIILQ